jgi:hypothetical protein
VVVGAGGRWGASAGVAVSGLDGACLGGGGEGGGEGGALIKLPAAQACRGALTTAMASMTPSWTMERRLMKTCFLGNTTSRSAMGTSPKILM